MKRFCHLLLTVCLTCGIGFPLFPRGNADRFFMEIPQNTMERQNANELQNREEPESTKDPQKKEAQLNTKELLNSKEQQDTTEFQNREEQKNREKLQIGEEQQLKEGVQNANVPQNSKELQGMTGLQNREELQNQAKIKLTGNRLTIENLPGDEVLEIYNIMGAKVFNRRVKAGTNQYILSLPRGYYIIKLGKLTRKIAIK